MIYPSR